MLSNILIAPSVNTLFLTGILLFSILVIFISNFRQFNRLDFYRKISILSLIAVAIGTHGLIHLGVESVYGLNPYRWI